LFGHPTPFDQNVSQKFVRSFEKSDDHVSNHANNSADLILFCWQKQRACAGAGSKQIGELIVHIELTSPDYS